MPRVVLDVDADTSRARREVAELRGDIERLGGRQGVGGVAGQGVAGAAPIGDEQLGGYDQRMRIEELRQLNQLELQRGEIQQGNYLREKSLLERQEAAEEKKYARVDQEEDRLRRLADIENQTQEQAHERAMQQDRERCLLYTSPSPRDS